LDTTANAAPAATGVAERDLAAFVGEHYPRLIRLAGLICREPSDAADAVQSGLEQAWRRREGKSDALDATRIAPRAVGRTVPAGGVQAGRIKSRS